MAKWEYCKIVNLSRPVTEEERQELEAQDLEFRFSVTGDTIAAHRGDLVFLQSDQLDQELERIPVLNTGQKIAELGLEGWELVSHTMLLHPVGAEVFYLKRPAPEPRKSAGAMRSAKSSQG